MALYDVEMQDDNGNVFYPHSNSETSRYTHPTDTTIDTVKKAVDDIYGKLGVGKLIVQDDTTGDLYQLGIEDGNFYTKKMDTTEEISVGRIVLTDDSTGYTYRLGINEERIYYQRLT